MVLLSEMQLKNSCEFFFEVSVNASDTSWFLCLLCFLVYCTQWGVPLSCANFFFIITIHIKAPKHGVVCAVDFSTFQINWFVVYLCACMVVFDSDSSLFRNAAHQHKCAHRKALILAWSGGAVYLERFWLWRLLLLNLSDDHGRLIINQCLAVRRGTRSRGRRSVKIVSWGILRFLVFEGPLVFSLELAL